MIIPELCSGCPVCTMVCPVDCIYVDEQWVPTDPQLWDHIELTSEGAVLAPGGRPPGIPPEGSRR